MSINRRSVVSIAVFVLLGVFVALGFWYESRQAAPGQTAADASIEVTSGDDRGAGSLREALFIAAAAEGKATITLNVPRIALVTTLPPVTNANGVQIVAQEQGTEIDASALRSGAVLDIAGPNVTIEGVHIRNCKAAGILLRAKRFRLQSATLQSCDVGVDIAENASQVLLERNRFVNNRVGVRIAATNRNTMIVKNEFVAHRDAAIWAVRREPDQRSGSVAIRENRFTKEPIGILTANVSVLIERNELLDSREAAMQLMGPGAVVRGNRVGTGAAMGIVAENARGVVIEDNELGGLEAYGIMLKGSADTLVRNNRVHNSGYGLAFVLGNTRAPSSAIDNTIIEPKINGIDVIGDSPILRNNKVMRPRGLALKVIDFEPENGPIVRSRPFLEGNNFDRGGTVVAADATAAAQNGVTRQ